jgi:hypothetical protein
MLPVADVEPALDHGSKRMPLENEKAGEDKWCRTTTMACARRQITG